RSPREPQPVRPIYAPEVAADAIVWASAHDRRELSVGATTAAIICVNTFAPGLLDRYLAWTAYDGQQTPVPADPNRPHNLWQPLPGDHGAHGRFGDRTIRSSPQTWANEHLPAVAMVMAGLVVLAWRARA